MLISKATFWVNWSIFVSVRIDLSPYLARPKQPDSLITHSAASSWWSGTRLAPWSPWFCCWSWWGRSHLYRRAHRSVQRRFFGRFLATNHSRWRGPHAACSFAALSSRYISKSLWFYWPHLTLVCAFPQASLYLYALTPVNSQAMLRTFPSLWLYPRPSSQLAL